LKKRSKKLLSVGASAAAGETIPALQAVKRWNDDGLYAKHPGEVFWFFFSKKNFFLSLPKPLRFPSKSA
jgi:hypothetical protein